MHVQSERNPCIVCKCSCCGLCKLFKSVYLNDNASVWNFMCISHLNRRTLYSIQMIRTFCIVLNKESKCVNELHVHK
jgi:hypothetical protein